MEKRSLSSPLIILSSCVMIFFVLVGFANKPMNTKIIVNNFQEVDSDEVTAIINKDTSEKELDDLKKFFAENDIYLEIDRLGFNKKDEIISLAITLKKGKSKSKYSSSSNEPITSLELGYKEGNLFIVSSGSSLDLGSASIMDLLQNHQSKNLDSIFRQFGFVFDMDSQEDSSFFNGKGIDLDQLRDQMKSAFDIVEEDGIFLLEKDTSKKSQRFNFVDNPDIEKLIIIDGKESDFESLDNLAKTDQLDDVDFLKPQTAKSIYGDKAKDGAIIAITKK